MPSTGLKRDWQVFTAGQSHLSHTLNGSEPLCILVSILQKSGKSTMLSLQHSWRLSYPLLPTSIDQDSRPCRSSVVSRISLSFFIVFWILISLFLITVVCLHPLSFLSGMQSDISSSCCSSPPRLFSCTAKKFTGNVHACSHTSDVGSRSGWVRPAWE